MITLKEKLAQKIEEQRPRIRRLVKEYGNQVIDQVTVRQVIGGMRGVKSLVTDISYLDPYEGIRFRGKTIPETLEALPKPPGKEMPYVEAHLWFLLTGEIPTAKETESLIQEFNARRGVPQYVYDILRALPRDSHPMAMFTTVVLAMQRESEFLKCIYKGVPKSERWEYMHEDAMNIFARLPVIAAYIYRMKYKNDIPIGPHPTMDLGANFAHMMGIPEPYDEVMRLYFILHSDHESGNVSAHTTHLVASALSDAYYSLTAGLCGLAGPLHGLANQEVLRWIQDMYKRFGGVPTKEEMEEFCWTTLKAGFVIPGYGHAVLRKTDPRYTAQREFCQKHLPNDELFKVVSQLYEIVPPILEKHGKAKNPWPNVDAHSGVIQWFYGVKEYDFYTVLFGIGRSMGVLANIVWDRALGYSIERPKSVTTDMLEKEVGIK
jgi:citrate synthase